MFTNPKEEYVINDPCSFFNECNLCEKMYTHICIQDGDSYSENDYCSLENKSVSDVDVSPLPLLLDGSEEMNNQN